LDYIGQDPATLECVRRVADERLLSLGVALLAQDSSQLPGIAGDADVTEGICRGRKVPQ
jgi:hypothetical protein